MKETIKLPDNIAECHAMIIEMARQIEQLKRRIFGSMKDRAVKQEGPSLFAEYDREVVKAAEEALEKATKEVEREAKRRREQSKNPASPKRPEKYNTYGLPVEQETVYPEGINPEDCEIIGQDVKRELHFEQAKLWVKETIYPKLIKKSDKSQAPEQGKIEIRQAPRIPSPLKGSHVAADFLATIIDNKYNHHLPEYRQIKMLAELGTVVPSSTLNEWMHRTADLLYCLYELQREVVLQGGYVQIDEVPWNIADRKGAPCRKGYAWQFRDVSPHPRGTFFYYHKGSRSGEIPRTQLKEYQGVIQNDGYNVYNQFENTPGITVLACMAHVRRKFVDAQKANPLAGEAVKYIATLYALEENLKAANATTEEIRRQRQQLAMPILEGLKVWMEMAYTLCTPKDPLATAIKYALSLWPRIMRYTEEGHYHIDSNPVEQGQRPTVLGRKNYLFSQNDRSAEDNAIFYTFVVSCTNLGINPYNWLKHTLDNIRPNMDDETLAKLLPCNYQEK